MANLNVKTVAILGAGTMGAQLAACFANAGIITLLYDIDIDLAVNAKKNLLKIKPEPLHTKSTQKLIKTYSYSNIDMLKNCDIVIEAIAENIDIKIKLFQKIAPFIAENTWLGTNTSGLSINTIAESLPNEIATRFLGIHFFNPPRYLPLLELIPSAKTNENIEPLINFFVSKLGKEIVIAPDSPNFIANRVGLFSLLLTVKNAMKFDIPLEVVDILTGTAIGRPKSATFRTADVVGLDILQNAVATSKTVKHDPWNEIHKLPEFIENMIANGHLGQKSKKGIYEKKSDGIYVYDLGTEKYRPANKTPPRSVMKILALKDDCEKLKRLSNSNEKHHKFLWLTLSELLQYCSRLCLDLGISTADLDNAICLGFGWERGPFTLWQNAGIQDTTTLIEKNITANSHNINTPLPEYIKVCENFFQENSTLNPRENSYLTLSQSSKENRSTFKRIVTAPQQDTSCLNETQATKLWTTNDDILIFSIKTKLATIDDYVLDDLNKAIEIAETENQPLVIWHGNNKNFGAGANLKVIGKSYMLGGKGAIKNILTKFQDTVMRLKYANIPSVAAINGLCLGGSVEIMLHSSHRVASFNSFIGLVEAGVGIIPGAGGSKEMAIRALGSQDPIKQLSQNFRTIAMGKLATSAAMAQEYGFLKQSDTVIANPNELLYVSKAYARALISSYSPPTPEKILVPGEQQIANFMFEITNLKAGGFASEHDCLIASKLANVMCGGNITKGQEVTEQYLLDLERENFMELLSTWKTKQRIAHMLKTGKRLAN